MRILSRNVAGLNNPGRFHEVINNARKFDIAMFQETKLSTRHLAQIRAKWGNSGVFMATDGARRGALTLFSSKLAAQQLSTFIDQRGQFVVNVVIIDQQTFLIMNVYGDPDTDANAALTMDRLTDAVDEIEHRFNIDHTICGGDFNLCLAATDRNSTTRKPRAEAKLSTLINTKDLFDVAALSSDAPSHTYFRHRRETTSARYDRFYVSLNLLRGITFKLMRRSSDHHPIYIEVLKHKTGPRQWRFNDNLLQSADFIQKLQESIKSTLQGFTNEPIPIDSHINNIQTHLDYDQHSSIKILSKLMENIRSTSMKETKILREKTAQKEVEAIEHLITVRQTWNDNPNPTEAETTALEEAQLKLKSIQTNRASNAAQRNYTNYATYGERTSSYHFAMANRGRPSRDIKKLVVETPAGISVLTDQEIVNHMTDKFAKIASPDPIAGTMTIEDFLGPELTATSRKCRPEDIAHIADPILKKEVTDIIGHLKTMSAPGPLGVTNSLLKTILPSICSLLIRVGNDVLFSDEAPEIPAWLFHRIVVFILKPGKPVTNEDSYRGLSMLENIFKLYSKILATRISTPLRHIQDPQQFGFTEHKGCLEASRTVIDAIHAANRENLPLIVLSTDFYKAFDSISLEHIENCLNFYDFPEKFVTAFMRLVRNGTMQFEVNSMLSDDHVLGSGVGQGDPKSSFGYNLSAAPLNYYLSNSPDVPRFVVYDTEIGPVYFADDELTLLKGDEIDLILSALQKIADYRRVSGLQLNLKKCEILTINCDENDIQRLLDATSMKRVRQLKHLGLIINERGEMEYETNFAPLTENMSTIAQQYNTSQSSPLGRAIYAKYLLSSKYIHRLQNCTLDGDQLATLRENALLMTWTRSRPNDDTNGYRVHIAQDRVSQPPRFGGLGVPDPLVQMRSIRFGWARKFLSANPQLSWFKILNKWLTQANRPDIRSHTVCGYREWITTGQALDQISHYWSQVFNSIAEILLLSHKYDKAWHLIPLIGCELIPDSDLHIGSLKYRNPAAAILIEAGLVNVGQLFHLNEVGHIDTSLVKSRMQLQTDYNVQISIPVMNSLAGLIRAIKGTYRQTMSSSTVLVERVTTIASLIRRFPKGCSVANSLLLKDARQNWSWGPWPRSFFTYQRDGLISISASDFSQAFSRIRASLTAPSIQWTSTQILLRTLWTRVKEANSARRNNDDPNLPFDTSCLNCGQHPEHTIHIFFQCQLAVNTWEKILECYNEVAPRYTRDTTSFPVTTTADMVLFQHTPNQLQAAAATDLFDLMMVTKHVLYRLRFRDNLQRYPTLRLVLIHVALEIEKIVIIRRKAGVWGEGMHDIQEELKSAVGF